MKHLPSVDTAAPPRKKRRAPSVEAAVQVGVRGAAFHFPESGLSTAALIKSEKPHRVFDLRERRQMGQKYVRTAAPGETPSSLATTAAEKALLHAGLEASALEMIVTAGCTPPDFDGWSMPAKIANNLGVPDVECFGIGEAGCCSAFAALRALVPMMQAPGGPNRVLLAAGCITPGGHFFEPATIYGDGAGALVLEKSTNGLTQGPRIVRADYYTNARWIDTFGPIAGFKQLRAEGKLEPSDWTVRVKKQAEMDRLIESTAERGSVFVKRTLDKAGWSATDLRWLILDNVAAVVPIEMAAIFGLPEGRVLLENVSRYGHAWVVDLFVNLATLLVEHPLQPGEKVACAAIGQGEHWGVLLLEA